MSKNKLKTKHLIFQFVLINKKLIRRHPHIFYDKKDPRYKEENWEVSKKKEKKRSSVLDGVPKSLPQLIRSSRIQEKAAGVGFDWDSKAQVLKKVDEEKKQLQQQLKLIAMDLNFE